MSNVKKAALAIIELAATAIMSWFAGYGVTSYILDNSFEEEDY